MNRMKRIIFALFIGATLASGCAARPAEVKTTLVNIAFQNWVGYGLFYLAQEKGFCEAEGLRLNFVDVQLDSARRDAFKAGMLDAEAGTMDLLVSKAAQETPILGVMELDQSNGADAIVAAENIKTLEDLAGKRVALARDDVGETFLSTLFHKKGLPYESITLVPKQAEEVAAAFLNGEADACATWEPQVSQALKRPGAHVLASTQDNPGIILDTLNVRKELLEKNPETVKGLMRAWFKALAWYRAHPAEASSIIAKYYGLTPDEYLKQVEGLKWESYEDQLTQLEDTEWTELFDAISSVKLADGRITQKPDAEKFMDRTLVEKLYES